MLDSAIVANGSPPDHQVKLNPADMVLARVSAAAAASACCVGLALKQGQ